MCTSAALQRELIANWELDQKEITLDRIDDSLTFKAQLNIQDLKVLRD